MIDSMMGPLWISLKVASCATLLSLVFGVVLAYVLARCSFRGKTMIEGACSLPLVLPPTVLGYYLLVLLGRNSGLGQYLNQYFDLQLIFTWQGAVIAASVVIFPLIVKPVRSAFESMDASLEPAARVLGLSNRLVFFRVALPMIMPTVIASACLGLARAFGEFGATLMVAGSIPDQTQTLSIAIYEAVQLGDRETANILVLLLSGVCLALVGLSSYLSRCLYIKQG